MVSKKQLRAVFFMKGKQIAELNVNEEIKSKKLLVIAPDGVQVGELELKKALILAEELELDLVEVSPESKPCLLYTSDAADE